MKFKVDENLPDDAAQLLRHAGFVADTVREEGLKGSDDTLVARAAKDENRALVTLDSDFGNIRA